MVSPLRTWQHQEPRYLWWLLGCLSMVTHVGVLGLSLPYVLELMAANAVRSPVTVPVELIAIAPTRDTLEEPTHIKIPETNRPSTTSTAPPLTAQQTPPATTSNVQRVADADSNQMTSSSSASDTLTANIGSAPPPDTVSSPANPTQISPAETIDTADDQPIRRPSAQVPFETPSEQAQLDPTPLDQASSGDGSAVAGDQRVTDNLIRRPGEINPIYSTQEEPDQTAQAQPSPDTETESAESEITESEITESEITESEIAESEILEDEVPLSSPAAGESDRAQAVSFRIVGARIAPVQDLPAKPPQLITNNSSIELQPSSLGCDLVDFSQPQQTYRLAIDATGNLRTITLWAEGRGQPLSDSAPMACLIRSAGLTFQPAKAVDGTPTLDDSLLLTVEVTALQRPNPNADNP